MRYIIKAPVAKCVRKTAGYYDTAEDAIVDAIALKKKQTIPGRISVYHVTPGLDPEFDLVYEIK